MESEVEDVGILKTPKGPSNGRVNEPVFFPVVYTSESSK